VNPVSSTQLILNRVNAGPDPAGDFGNIFLGTLAVTSTGLTTGALQLRSTSVAVNARMLPTATAISIPLEPIAVPPRNSATMDRRCCLVEFSQVGVGLALLLAAERRAVKGRVRLS
jgi:hypothetical protein